MKMDRKEIKVMKTKDRCMSKNEENLRKSPAWRDESGHCLNMCGFSYNMDCTLAAEEGGESDA